jgi:superfamily II DNA or RNA helicase
MDDYRLLSDAINIVASEADSRTLIMPHQQEAVDALTEYYDITEDINKEQNGLMVMPTGSGKTFTAVNWLLTSGIANGYKIVWLAHRQELIDQTNNEFRKQAPVLTGSNIKKLKVLPVSGMNGHFKMSMASKADIYICSIASVANKYGYRFIRRMLGEAGKRKLIVVVDEAHHIVAPQYQKVLKRITEINQGRLLLGLTATPTRMQENDLKKLLKIFEVEKNIKEKKGTKNGFIYEVTLKQLLASGFLAKPIREKVNTEIHGEIEYEFTPEDETYFETFAELSEKVMTQISRSSARNKIIVEQYIKNKERYGKTLIFAVNQMHAETLCSELKNQGIKCDYVVSGKAGTQQTIADFKQNKFDVLVNVQILTEGSDVPHIKTVFLTRETNSDSLLMQMIGRGLRGEKAGGTDVAYIVDFHDSWDKYKFWIDPGMLDIFNELDGETIQDGIIINEKVSAKIDVEPLEIPMESQGNDLNMHDFYMKLYNIMRVSLSSTIEAPVCPCGWYSVVNSDGNQEKILVYEEQLNSYSRIDKFKDRLIKKRLSAQRVIQMFFDNCKEVPTENELEDFLDLLYETDEMPEYYTFEQRKQIDPKNIADEMNSLFEKEEDKEA